ncbi:MAG: two-component system response regulator [Desulfuromonas sp.]|nr:MAG: two-component system response regulator [Desulfuromonas sp.]
MEQEILLARILIAEDSDTELEYLKQILHGTPHQLTVTRDGLQAEAAAKAAPHDLIILDVIMPGKNGFQVCRSLKKDDRTKLTPIILLTAKTGSSDKFWGLKQGADEYITKPYEPGNLLSSIAKQLGAS